ncbi:MAG: SUMF1/EgtB/PvdO family nonheme iron enzyme [Phycisphaerales bacterium]
MKHIAAMVVGGAVLASPALAGDTGFDWVTIGDAGNRGYDRPAADPFITGRGSVGYEYRIAREEVTSGQWLTFVNTFATQSDEYGELFDIPPISWGAERDFSYSGPGIKYKLRTDVANADRLPVLGMSWREAAYFVNWLNNDMSNDASAILDGAYDTSTFIRNPDGTYQDQTTHHADAEYWIPTYDEWFKAAHYDPHKDGSGGWWLYNDGSDTEPIAGPPGEGEASARWLVDDSGRPAWETPLGSYPETTSPWGLLDITGGGAEWTEEWAPSCCGNSGRYFDGSPAGLNSFIDAADRVGGANPDTHGFLTTLRVAGAVPSPGTAVPLGLSLTLACRRRRGR